jgi:hypothetical protein
MFGKLAGGGIAGIEIAQDIVSHGIRRVYPDNRTKFEGEI